MIRFLSAVFPLMLLGCGNTVLIEETWTWQDQVWSQDDAKQITLEATDTTTVYRMDLQLEHAETYKYQNLYVKTVTRFPSGKEVTSVTSLELAKRGGIWDGKCRCATCRITLPLQQRFTFPELGTYSWTIVPYMRTDSVAGIKRLTVTCTQAEP